VQAFRSVAALYERARPGYPPEAVEFLVARLGLVPGRVVADVAAGTGKLTRELVGSGAQVIAVEPLAEMRSVLASLGTSAEVLEGTAESLPLADTSVDAVTVAQAFHWFDAPAAIAELGRVLRPGGGLALVWNIRDLEDPVQQALNDLLAPYRGDARSEHEQPWREDLELSPLFGPGEVRSFAWVQPYTREDLAARIASVSFVAGLAEDVREELLERVRSLADVAGDPFPFRYRTDVYLFPRSRGQGSERRG
jgi:ubiquinone/menaquinone biosynthesis C-methylase UbiE